MDQTHLKEMEERAKDKMFNKIMEVSPPQESSLLSKDQAVLKQKLIFDAFMSRLKGNIESGINILSQRMKEHNKKLAGEFAHINLEEFAEKMAHNKDTPIYKIAGFSNELMGAFHKEAIDLFNEKNYQDATKAFFALIYLNHLEHKYWIGYGLSERLSPNHNIRESMMAFSMAISLCKNNPYPYMYLADDFYATGELEKAKANLEMALLCAKQEEQYDIIIPIIQDMINTLKNK